MVAPLAQVCLLSRLFDFQWLKSVDLRNRVDRTGTSHVLSHEIFLCYMNDLFPLAINGICSTGCVASDIILFTKLNCTHILVDLKCFRDVVVCFAFFTTCVLVS